MFYLITDPNYNDYAILEGTKDNDIITHIYVHSITENVWAYALNFTTLKRKAATHGSLKGYLNQKYQLLFEATSMQELMELIDRHPEVFIWNY